MTQQATETATPQPPVNGAAERAQALAIRKEEAGIMASLPPEAQAFELAQRQARVYASSTIVPDTYKNNVGNCLIAMSLARRIGADVLIVMQNLNIIHGRPSFSSQFLIGTVNQCKRFSPLRFRFQGKEGAADWGCRAYAKDLATGEECVGALITLGMAKEEGWSTKSGSKWKTMPEQMLQYRAAAFWTRIYAPDLSLGMSTDEVDDVGPRNVPDVLANAPASNLEAKLAETPAQTVPHDPITGELLDDDPPKKKDREPGEDDQ
jgi:hypothetical protein